MSSPSTTRSQAGLLAKTAGDAFEDEIEWGGNRYFAMGIAKLHRNKTRSDAKGNSDSLVFVPEASPPDFFGTHITTGRTLVWDCKTVGGSIATWTPDQTDLNQIAQYEEIMEWAAASACAGYLINSRKHNRVYIAHATLFNPAARRVVIPDCPYVPGRDSTFIWDWISVLEGHYL